jgi:hypothetical protein
MTVGCERSDATPQQEALELLYVAIERGHAATFAVLGRAPAKAAGDWLFRDPPQQSRNLH